MLTEPPPGSGRLQCFPGPGCSCPAVPCQPGQWSPGLQSFQVLLLSGFAGCRELTGALGVLPCLKSGLSLAALTGRREKRRCQRSFRDSQPCPVAAESRRDAVQRARPPHGGKLVASSTPVPQLPPASAERHPVHQHGPSGSNGHIRKGQSSPGDPRHHCLR